MTAQLTAQIQKLLGSSELKIQKDKSVKNVSKLKVIDLALESGGSLYVCTNYPIITNTFKNI